MKELQSALDTVINSSYHHEVSIMTQLLKENFGVSHFWYYKMTDCGNFSYYGSHAGFNNYCAENNLIENSPSICHPSTQPIGIQFVGVQVPDHSKEIMDVAWDRFKLNFNLNLNYKIEEGIESFGFATNFKNSSIDQQFINDIPILKTFIKVFKERNTKFFNLLNECAVDVSKIVAKRKISSEVIPDRTEFLKKLGFEEILTLSARETEVMKLLINGFPATYIANELHLSKRTIEHYIDNLKNKLFCNTKIELIQKAKDFQATGYFQ